MPNRHEDIRALLLDMNDTFMFGHDRFDDTEDFSVRYRQLGGRRGSDDINALIRRVYRWLDERYPDPRYLHDFPSLQTAIQAVGASAIDDDECRRIVDVFSFHELGDISAEYVELLTRLSRRYRLAAVIDIWAPKQAWLQRFRERNILQLFTCLWFSSDHGIVKPSPQPYRHTLECLGVRADQALVIGDSIRRDLGGAVASGISCVLVGGARDDRALHCIDSLFDLPETIG